VQSGRVLTLLLSALDRYVGRQVQRHWELGQGSCHKVEALRGKAERINLARGGQTAQNLANLAAAGQGAQEDLDLFAGCGNHRRQIDGGKHGYCRNLRGAGSLLHGLHVFGLQQMPLAGLALLGLRIDAQLRPKFVNCAQCRCLGNLAAKLRLEFGGGQRPLGLKDADDLDGEL
jgi:hypothetical protein